MTSIPRATLCSTAVLTSFYIYTVDSIYRGITSWYSRCFVEGAETAQKIMGTWLSAIQDIYSKRCLRKAEHIKKQSSQPAQTLFCFLPAGKQVRSISRGTSKYRDNLHFNAVRLFSHTITLDTSTCSHCNKT